MTVRSVVHRPQGGQRRTGSPLRPSRVVAAATALLLPMALGFPAVAAHAAVSAPVGQGFTVTPSDLAFILKQIKIAERHAATLSPAHVRHAGRHWSQPDPRR